MSLYFNSNDLRARLNKTSCWVHDRALALSKSLKYEGRIDDCKMADLSLVVASIEALECYTPITSDDDDFNCLTEAEAEQLFNNISKITGLCFLPKNTAYKTITDDDDNQNYRATGQTLVGGASMKYNILQTETLKRS